MDQMSRDKQIDDLAEKIREIKEYITDRDGITYGERYVTVSHSERIAKHLLDADYRKASDVAREIFEDVESLINLICLMTGLNIKAFDKYIKLKKKYESTQK